MIQNIITLVAGSEIVNDSILKGVNKILNNNCQIKIVKPQMVYDIFHQFDNDDIREKIDNLIDKKPIDVFFLNSNFRKKKKLLLSDMDSTLIQNECIDEIARSIGKYDEIAAITKSAMEGNLLFENSLEERVLLLKGVNKNKLKVIFDQIINLTDGAFDLAEKFSKEGTKLVIVSGGFVEFCSELAKKINFDEYYANEFLYDQSNNLTGKVKLPVFSSESKLEVLEDIMHKDKIDEYEVIGIGDGANDLPFLQRIPFSVGYRAKGILAQKVQFNIKYTDLSSVAYIAGL